MAGASPNLNFVLGLKQGINQCLKSAMSKPVTLCLIGGSVLAAKLKNATALAGIVATGRVLALGPVMRDLQNDINNLPDPYQIAIGYGRRFCIWIGLPSPLRGAGAGPAGANPLAPAARGRLALCRVHRRWCVAARCALRRPTNGCLS